MLIVTIVNCGCNQFCLLVVFLVEKEAKIVRLCDFFTSYNVASKYIWSIYNLTLMSLHFVINKDK